MRLEEFKNWLTVYCNRQKTIQNYYSAIKRFSDKFQEVTQENINSYITDLITRGLSNSVINQFIYAMQKYAKFASISVELPEPRPIDQKVKKSLTEEELDAVLAKLEWAVKEPDKYKAILLFLFYTGLRREELVNLKRADFNFEEKTITINKTKTYKGRTAILPDNAIKAIQFYFLREREEKNAFNISYSSIYSILKRIGKMFNCPDKFNPHAFRRSATKHLLKITNNDYRVVKKQLGHANITTTIGYAELNNEEAGQIITQAFKKNKIKSRK